MPEQHKQRLKEDAIYKPSDFSKIMKKVGVYGGYGISNTRVDKKSGDVVFAFMECEKCFKEEATREEHEKMTYEEVKAWIKNWWQSNSDRYRHYD